MKASVLVREVQRIIDNEGNLDVDISVAKSGLTWKPERRFVNFFKKLFHISCSQQQYLVADATFILVEEYEDPKQRRIQIRDWPY